MAKKPKKDKMPTSPLEGVVRLVIEGNTFPLKGELLNLGALWDDIRVGWILNLPDIETERKDIERRIAGWKDHGCTVELVRKYLG